MILLKMQMKPEGEKKNKPATAIGAGYSTNCTRGHTTGAKLGVALFFGEAALNRRTAAKLKRFFSIQRGDHPLSKKLPTWIRFSMIGGYWATRHGETVPHPFNCCIAHWFDLSV
jgi:hypothetical protein